MDRDFFYVIDEARDHMHAMGIPGGEWEKWLWLLRFECRVLRKRLTCHAVKNHKETT